MPGDYEDKGLAGAVERMMYGTAGPPKVPEPEKPRPTIVDRVGNVIAVVLCAALVFGVVMACIAIFQAVLG